jgi:hypothetical protein
MTVNKNTRAFQYKQRMYGLVPYNISPIQQGIQFCHAVVDYGLTQTQQDSTDTALSPYNQWAHNDKTSIILNGGTTNTQTNRYGTLNKHLETLFNMGVVIAPFYEPDLGDQLTAVVFLVDERVWDKETYPNYDYVRDEVDETTYYLEIFDDDILKILELRDFLSQFTLA